MTIGVSSRVLILQVKLGAVLGNETTPQEAMNHIRHTIPGQVCVCLCICKAVLHYLKPINAIP